MNYLCEQSRSIHYHIHITELTTSFALLPLGRTKHTYHKSKSKGKSMKNLSLALKKLRYVNAIKVMATSDIKMMAMCIIGKKFGIQPIF